MPELPEVETLKRELGRVLVGKKVKGIKVLWAKTIAPLSPKTFAGRLIGQKIEQVERRAKILIFHLSGGDFLLTHLKMTGQLIYLSGGLALGSLKARPPGVVVGGHPEDPSKYTRLSFDFTDGSQLLFNDLRKFGWMKLVDSKKAEKILGTHGIEPLSKEFTYQKFEEILNKYPARKVKQLLLDQTLIAGLGNIYVDEACFRAFILPTRKVSSLTETEKKDLHRGIVEVLKLSISKKGTSSRNYRRSNGELGGFIAHLNVYGREGEPCKRCSGTIRKIKLNGRGTHFCDQCQK